MQSFGSDDTYRQARQIHGDVDRDFFREHDIVPHRFVNDEHRLIVTLVHSADERARKRTEALVEGM